MGDIRYRSADKKFARLSNLTKREFIFRGVRCNSIEGVLQSLKFEDPEKQRKICLLHGLEAQQSGQGIDWQHDRTVYWQGKPIKRGSEAYEEILEEIFSSAFEGDSSFRGHLLATGNEELDHTIGKANQLHTVLTRFEYLALIRGLRDRAHREKMA